MISNTFERPPIEVPFPIQMRRKEVAIITRLQQLGWHPNSICDARNFLTFCETPRARDEALALFELLPELKPSGRPELRGEFIQQVRQLTDWSLARANAFANSFFVKWSEDQQFYGVKGGKA